MTYLDLPQNFDPELGGRFYVGELRRIAARAGASAARGRSTREALRARPSRTRTSGGRRWPSSTSCAAREPWRLRATEAYLACRAGHAAAPRDEHAAAAPRAASTRCGGGRRACCDNARVVLVGAFCEQPPLDADPARLETRRLRHRGRRLPARAAHGSTGRSPRAPSDPSSTRWPAPSWSGARPTPPRYIADGRKGAGAGGARCGSRGADGRDLRRRLLLRPRAARPARCWRRRSTRPGIPHTSFKFSENTGQFQTIREQAGAFSDAVKLWGEA